MSVEDSTKQPIAVMIGQLVHGGTERQLYSFLANCDRAKWAPTVFVSGEMGIWEQPIRDLQIPVVPLNGGRLAKMLQFRAACAEIGARVFFSWSSHTNGFGLALAGRGMYRVGSFRNALFSDLPERLRRIWEWSSLAGISTVVCNSREAQLECESESDKHKVYYVPNAVDVFPLEQVRHWREKWRARLGVDAQTPLIVGVGRLAPQKNFARFIEAVSLVRERLPVRAAIAGPDCGCMADLKQQIADKKLENCVQLLGGVPDARELICAADILLLSSDHEGMPNVILEAMAAGTPCVTTPVNSVGDLIVSGETGFIGSFEAGELAELVYSLARDVALRASIGEKARAWVASAHDPRKIAATLWDICDKRI